MDINSKTAFEAIKDERIDILEKLLHQGLDVNHQSQNGRILLYEAVVSRNVETVKLLLTWHANVNVKYKNNNGESPLHEAVRGDQVAMVKILLEADADVNARNKHGLTPLYLALQKGRKNTKEIVILLLNKGADANDATEDGTTLLYMAIRNKQTEIVKILLENNADIHSGKNPLLEAVSRDNAEITELLLDNGADINSKKGNGKDFYISQVIGKTALYVAIQRKNIEMVKLLVAHGADINNTLIRGSTHLNKAIGSGRRDIVNVLLNHGADLTVQDIYGYTALHEAVYYGRLELVEQLIKNGATVDAKNIIGDTPLHRAIQRGDRNSSRFDLNSKADKIRYYTITEPTSTEVINILLKNGANIEAKNKRQETPLFYAVRFNKLSFVDFLLDNEADINLKSDCGTVCLNSRERLSEEMITLLQRHIIKRKSAGFHLNKDILEKYPFDMLEYQIKCIKEIMYLKNEFIYDGISLFDLLSKPTTQLSYYSHISDMTKSINLSEVKKNCTQYYNLIYNKIQNAARRKELLEYGEMFFDSLSVNLPYTCRQYILNYLDTADLIIFEKLFSDNN